MQISGVRLLVRDFSAAVHFWQESMGLSLQFRDDTLGYAYFETEKIGLELYTQDGFASALGEVTPVPLPQGRQVVLNVRVEDVDTAYKKLLEQGATPVSTPRDRPAWMARTAHVADPDGHVIELFMSLPEAASPTA